MNNDSESSGSSQKWRQFLVSISANLMSASIGICLAWSSPSIVRLQDKESTPLDEPINSDQVGWLISLLSLGAVFGPVFVWQTIDKFGRKWCLLCSSIIYTISVVLLLLTIKKLWIIYIARFLQGLTVGIVNTSQPIYNCEIATDDCRGSLGSIMQLFMLCAISYMITFGSILSYQNIQWACFPFCILFPIIFIFMPDTPHYYILKQNYHKAIKTLKFLRGHSESKILNEYDNIRLSVEQSSLLIAKEKQSSSIYNLIKSKQNLNALCITIGLMISQQMTGSSAILSNLQNTFELSNTSTTIDCLTFLLISSISQIFASFISVILVDKFGRKIILLISGGLITLSLIGLGLFFHIQKSSSLSSTLTAVQSSSLYRWIPFICLTTYIISYALGYGPIPWIFVGELFSSNIKSLASSVTVSFCWILSFIIGKTYPTLADQFGIDIILWLYAICVLFSIIFIYVFIFETKGMSLHDIQNKLSRKL